MDSCIFHREMGIFSISALTQSTVENADCCGKCESAFKSLSLFPDTHFMVGASGLIPNEVDGFIIPDERASDQSLGQYRNRTILLVLPKQVPDFRSIRWISVWSKGLARSLAEVIVPPPINVPPALDKIGVQPQVING